MRVILYMVILLVMIASILTYDYLSGIQYDEYSVIENRGTIEEAMRIAREVADITATYTVYPLGLKRLDRFWVIRGSDRFAYDNLPLSLYDDETDGIYKCYEAAHIPSDGLSDYEKEIRDLCSSIVAESSLYAPLRYIQYFDYFCNETQCISQYNPSIDCEGSYPFSDIVENFKGEYGTGDMYTRVPKSEDIAALFSNYMGTRMFTRCNGMPGLIGEFYEAGDFVVAYYMRRTAMCCGRYYLDIAIFGDMEFSELLSPKVIESGCLSINGSAARWVCNNPDMITNITGGDCFIMGDKSVGEVLTFIELMCWRGPDEFNFSLSWYDPSGSELAPILDLI